MTFLNPAILENRTLAGTNAAFRYGPIGLLTLCAAMNFLLAIINQWIAPVSTAMVVGVQLLLTGTAGLAALRGIRFVNRLGILALLILLAVSMGGAAIQHNVSLLGLYNVLIIPIFIGFGAASRTFPAQHLWFLFGVVFATAFFEWQFTDIYAAVVNPFGYFANTREWFSQLIADEHTYDSLSSAGLYLNAIRPDDSYFSQIFGSHRVGSVFLEPLSTGYFCIICALFFLKIYRGNYFWQCFAVAACLCLAILSDTRLAVMLTVLFAVAYPAMRYLPFVFIFVLPLIYAGVLTMLYFPGEAGWLYGDLPERVAVTVEPFTNAGFTEILFGGVEPTGMAGDSGIVQLSSQFGLIGVWLYMMICCGALTMRHPNHFIAAGALTYLLAAATFGGAFLSIKTASLLGFLVGYTGSGIAGNRGL